MRERARKDSRGRPRKHSRGAVAAEAALVTPLVLLIVFGIIEMAFLMRDNVALSSLVRQGGRIASAALAEYSGQSTEESPDCHPPDCLPGNVPELADQARDWIMTAGAAIPKDSIKELWVYKANAQGYPGVDGNSSFNSCSADCVAFRWNGTTHSLQHYAGSWRADDIDACRDTDDLGLDTVGVYMEADHTFLTGFIAKDVDISDHAVFIFEPLEPIVCSERL